MLCVIGLTGLVIVFPPVGIVPFAAFFLLLFSALFYLLRFALNHTRRALLLSTGITMLLLLRALGLRHWLYPLLISALLISIEVYAQKK